ncbi:MAG: tetratricopeptide repeat protein [Candidatus Anammoxibacter sp.]
MTEHSTYGEKYQERVVRVFISSTFRDMHAEREELVKQVFPELRKRCQERGIEFTEVDLRWGLTEEQKEKGEVLPVCLAEIERCHPYFVGMLGERYGWVPEKINEELIEEQRWLKEHKEKSVTELEIIHGVLKNPEMRGFAFFYFRDPKTSQVIEEELAKKPKYEKEPEKSKAKLAKLKEKILESNYPVEKNYPDSKSLGEGILKNLWDVINKRFPEGTKPTDLERERMDHEAFAVAKRKVYIGKDDYYERLDRHIKGDGPPLVLMGESGSGKSALIANWVEKYRKKHPDDFMVSRFIGGTPDSADYVNLLRRIMEEIRERYESKEEGVEESHLSIAGMKEDEIPTDPKKVVEAFPLWLGKAAAKGKFILILDGLNQLDDRDNAPDLGWLPQYIPKNVRLILSTLPGRSLDALEKRDWMKHAEPLKVEPLNADEREKFIVKCLKRYSKELSPEFVNRIAEAQQTANPLYLRTLIEELRIFGVHEELEDRIDHYLKAETVKNLFEKVLERYEEDYERDRPGLTRDVMSLIWASRRGLSETELLELLGSAGKPLPQAFWSPLYLAAEESLVSRSGLLNFFHDFLRNAVESKYQQDQNAKRKTHLYLADYFEKRELDDRKVNELPWQLAQAEEWGRLKDCVAEPEMFLKLSTDEKKYELTGYWRDIGDRFDMVETYNAAIAEHERSNPADEKLVYLLNQVAEFLYLNARHKGAELLYRRALKIDEASYDPDHPHVAMGLNNLALLLMDTNRYSEAEPLCRRALKIWEASFGPCHPLVANGELNLQTMFRLSGQKVDINKVKEATRILEEAKDQRAEKGHKLLKELTGNYKKIPQTNTDKR